MSDEDGFTLIELLVAMVAASLLLGLLGWTIASLAHELDRSRRDDKAAELVALAPVLRGLLEGAVADRTPANRFEGSADGLSATVPPPQVLGLVGPVRLQLMVRRGRTGEGLYVSFAPSTDAGDLPPALTEPRALIEGLRSIDFDYVPRDPAEQLSTPRLITLSFADEHGLLAPITIAPQVNGTGACRFDPISMTCRP